MKISRRNFVRYSTGSLMGLTLSSYSSRSYDTPISLSQEIPSNIIDIPVHQLAWLIRKKKLSSYEVVSAFIKRIEEVNPRINAVVTFRPEEALREAREADNYLRQGNKPGLLHGIPCTIKDSFDTKGIVSTAGTKGRSQFIPTKDATVVDRIKKAGAIIVGKTNTPELTMEFFTDNLIYGKTKNPHSLLHSPGGSSGGAAAIVAAGGSPFDIGSDTGGSIRFPAHCCGIAGLKPTAGRVPRTGHIISFRGVPQLLTHVGPMARNVEDLNLLLRVIAGVDNEDPYTFPVKLTDYSAVNLKNIRVAFFTNNTISKCTEEVVSATMKVVKIISDAKLNIQESIPNGIEFTAELSDRLINSGDWIKRILDESGTTETSLTWALGKAESSDTEYTRLMERIDAYKSNMLSFWNNFDVLICPASPAPAQLLGTAYEGEPYYSYTSAFNLTGWPAAVIPAAVTKEQLPIGVQIVAPPWREDIVIALAKFLENELGEVKRPGL